MEQKEWDMQSLINALLKSIREYGIKEVSIGQYETVCKKIAHFVQSAVLTGTIKDSEQIMTHLLIHN